jgi:hypothetical protein
MGRTVSGRVRAGPVVVAPSTSWISTLPAGLSATGFGAGGGVGLLVSRTW